MNRQLYPLLIAQFLSAFGDNAILFTIIAMVLHSAHVESWYVPALQSVFLVAYVVLAPWADGFADRHPKWRVLLALPFQAITKPDRPPPFRVFIGR